MEWIVNKCWFLFPLSVVPLPTTLLLKPFSLCISQFRVFLCCLPFPTVPSNRVMACLGKGERGRITESLHRSSASGCFTHVPAQSGFDESTEKALQRSWLLATAIRLRLSRLPHEREIELLYLSPSSSPSWHSNQRSQCGDIKFLEQLDTKLQQWYCKGKRENAIPRGRVRYKRLGK